MTQHRMTAEVATSVDTMVHALRRVRPSVYRIDAEADRTTITLTVRASAAGRHNAAMRIVSALADGGVGLVADDPIDELARGASLVMVRQPG
ncbi:MAG TPA: hypothetical protein VFN75_12135 [Pseudonocardiaceae bacterium]|nr:hypothetical protein [Pseudonocardiaceae bacterium]